MQKEELEALFNCDTLYLEDSNVKVIDAVIFSNYENKLPEEIFAVYSKFVSMKHEAPEPMKENLFATIRNFAQEQIKNGDFVGSLLLYRFLYVKKGIKIQDYPFIAENLANLNKKEDAIKFIEQYKSKEENKLLMYLTLANFYNRQIGDFKIAIEYYEKYIEIDKTKSVVYNILANLYSKFDGDGSLEKQIEYYKKSYELKPDNRLALHGLAFSYEKLGDFENADIFYKKLLENNPTVIDYSNYGMHLIRCGKFIEGHKYFIYRNLVDNEIFKKSITNTVEKLELLKSDFSDKTILVHYEQGFGDTFMYCRFLPLLKERAKKVIFVVQNELYDLIKNSFISEGIEVVTDYSGLSFDVGIMLLDAPYVLGTEASTIPFKEGYLNVDPKLVDNYNKKYLKTDKNFKIGVAYSGDSGANYNSRDINIEKFRILSGKDVSLYSLQKDENASCPGITSLGTTFNNFTDTACAIKNMDLVISTDNVILNLAGALGVKAIGLFNKQANYRWFKLEGNDVGWYKSVRPIQAIEQNDWEFVFEELLKIISVKS